MAPNLHYPPSSQETKNAFQAEQTVQDCPEPHGNNPEKEGPLASGLRARTARLAALYGRRRLDVDSLTQGA